MIHGFWSKLKKPILALAPMADVTDAAFRRIIAKYGKPDVSFTEFTSADGLCSPKGREALMHNLWYEECERPIVAQLFSGKPEKMFEAAKLVRELGFDGLDINMGCPDRSIEKSCAGASLIKNPKLAREIIRAAKRGADPLPVSIKTRLGYNKDELDTWLPELLSEEPSAIIIHARTRKEMSLVPAHWERIRDAVRIRDSFFSSPPARGGDLRGGVSKTMILGNGDVASVAEAKMKAEETGADGIMLGRATFGNPWLFAKQKEDLGFMINDLGIEKKLSVLVEHTKLFEELFTTIRTTNKIQKYEKTHLKSFAVMKKHFKSYVTGWDDTKELRVKLMKAENAAEVEKVVREYLKRP